MARVHDLGHGQEYAEKLYGLIGGIAVGLIIGGLLGWKNRRDVLDAADDLLDQIDELRNS